MAALFPVNYTSCHGFKLLTEEAAEKRLVADARECGPKVYLYENENLASAVEHYDILPLNEVLLLKEENV